MEPNIQNQSQPFKPNGLAIARPASSGGQTATDKFSNTTQAVLEHVENRGAEMMAQAKQKASEVYDQVNKNLSKQYGKAIDYSRDNPGKTTLIAFGVGIGAGLLLLSNFIAPRRRRSTVVEPVISAATTLARKLFR